MVYKLAHKKWHSQFELEKYRSISNLCGNFGLISDRMDCDNVQLHGWLQNIAAKITASIFNDLLV